LGQSSLCRRDAAEVAAFVPDALGRGAEAIFRKQAAAGRAAAMALFVHFTVMVIFFFETTGGLNG
jgi:hypothetical protein